MKKIILALCCIVTLFLTGCFENTQEITLNEDGSGTLNNSNDMSALIGLVKQMGAGAELDKAPQQNIDSVISLEKGADSISGLTPEEREIARKGKLGIKANLKEEKFKTSLVFSFSSPSQVSGLNKLTNKILADVMKDKLAEGAPMADQMPEMSSIDDYYKLEFSNGELTKKVDKDKYSNLGSDEYLKGMKEAASMGLVMKANYVFNLPRPATKAEGKNVKLSEDKKKVTITATLDDFFDDPSALEFKIKY
ncbi:MAG TPA: hypothetical protein VMZ03_03380 [Chitinophagaceae bacterium]|nr:hypothetical protein [Chitinophagaceae bacterium]